MEVIMVRDLLNRIIDGGSLDSAEAEELMRCMMDEELTPIQLGAFLVALRAKGETPDEVVGFARTMRSRARQIATTGPLADTCGTGGDGRGTFNIGTVTLTGRAQIRPQGPLSEPRISRYCLSRTSGKMVVRWSAQSLSLGVWPSSPCSWPCMKASKERPETSM